MKYPTSQTCIVINPHQAASELITQSCWRTCGPVFITKSEGGDIINLRWTLTRRARAVNLWKKHNSRPDDVSETLGISWSVIDKVFSYRNAHTSEKKRRARKRKKLKKFCLTLLFRVKKHFAGFCMNQFVDVATRNRKSSDKEAVFWQKLKTNRGKCVQNKIITEVKLN